MPGTVQDTGEVGGSESRYQAICRRLREEAPILAKRMVRQWEEIGGREPWLKLPEDLSIDHLPDLIRALADAARSKMQRREDRERLVRLGARHGQDRMEGGHPEDLLFREYHLLRRTVWDELREAWGSGSGPYEAILQIDAGITLSSSASLHGYHRPQYEERGEWPDALDRLLEEWPRIG